MIDLYAYAILRVVGMMPSLEVSWVLSTSSTLPWGVVQDGSTIDLEEAEVTVVLVLSRGAFVSILTCQPKVLVVVVGV